MLLYQIRQSLRGVLEDGPEAGYVPRANLEGVTPVLGRGDGPVPKLGDGCPLGLALMIGGGLLLFRLGLGILGSLLLLGGAGGCSGGSIGLVGVRCARLALAGRHTCSSSSSARWNYKCCFASTRRQIVRLQPLDELCLATPDLEAQISQAVLELLHTQGAEVFSFSVGGRG